jgi:hypothetical protein
VTRIRVEVTRDSDCDMDVTVYMIAAAMTKDVIVAGLSRFVPSELFEVNQINKGERHGGKEELRNKVHD